MIKTVTANDVQMMMNGLSVCWENEKGNLRLGPVSLYNLIGLKKKIFEISANLQETVSTFALQAGAEQVDGGLRIPEDKVQEVNAKLNELAKESVDIDYTPVIVKGDDVLPPTLMELLFDFIEIQE